MDKELRQIEVLVPEVPKFEDFESITEYLRKLYQYLLDNSILAQQKVELFSYGTLEDNGTPDVTANHKRSFYVTGGTSTITNFLKGYHGQVIEIVADHELTIEHNSNIRLANSESYVMAANDTIALIFMERSEEKWYELYRGGVGAGVSPKILFEFYITGSVTAIKETMDGTSDQGDAAISSSIVDNITAGHAAWYDDQDYDELTAAETSAKVTMDETSDQGSAAVGSEIIMSILQVNLNDSITLDDYVDLTII